MTQEKVNVWKLGKVGGGGVRGGVLVATEAQQLLVARGAASMKYVKESWVGKCGKIWLRRSKERSCMCSQGAQW